MLIGDVVIAPFGANPVRLGQHLGVGSVGGWLKLVASQFHQQPQRVAEVDGVHEASVYFATVANIPLV